LRKCLLWGPLKKLFKLVNFLESVFIFKETNIKHAYFEKIPTGMNLTFYLKKSKNFKKKIQERERKRPCGHPQQRKGVAVQPQLVV
jgi:hypothetical protein